MKNSFNDLGISPPILKALEEMGFENPTEVQSKAIPHILKQEDLIVMSKTGSGKTAVFGVSMLQLIDPKITVPQGLILTPTRELAVQVDIEIKKMAKYTRHKSTAIYGQHSMNTEIQAFNRGVSIVTGTPGRVYDHIKNKNLATENIRFLILDEADRMLDMGFLDQVVKIIRTLPKNRVTLLFSATIPSEIRRICKEYMKQPVTIEIKSETKTVNSIEQIYYRVKGHEKNTKLNHLLLIERPESCMIFCNTRATVDRVKNFLYRKGYNCQALHGDIPQGKRMKTIQQFKQGNFHLLVATDVAARGIHIDNLSLVINYDVPLEKDSYVHRIGRTGRAGNCGRALSLVTSEDIMSLYAIEEHIGTMIPEGELPTAEMYKNQKAEADKWAKANAVPVRTYNSDVESFSKRPSKTYSGPNSKRPQSNQYPKKPKQQYNKHTNKTGENFSYNKTANKTANRTGSTYANHRQQRPAPNYRQHKSAQTNAKSVQNPLHNAAVNTINKNPEAQKTENVKTKKTFIQRVLQKIFSK